MNVLLIILGLIACLVEIVAGCLSLISAVTLTGYFFVRIILKIMCLHSGSAEQVKKELKVAAACAALVAFTFAWSFLMALMVGD